MPDGREHPRKRLLYGRRQGHRLSPRRRRLLETLLPEIAAAPDDGKLKRPADLFEGRPSGIFLEIGFGGGEHLVARALRNPDRGYIGAEPFVNGVARLLAKIDECGIANVRIHHGDARDVVDALPDRSIAGIYLLYPDPWPKKRHHKRRFVNPGNLDRLHRIMAADARLLFASDEPGYVRWTLAAFANHLGFEWTARRPSDWRSAPDGWPGTRYEDKALREGRRPHYLLFRRT